MSTVVTLEVTVPDVLRAALLLVILVLCPGPGRAQPESPDEPEEPPDQTRCRFELHDSTRVLGTIDRTQLDLQTAYGRLEIPLDEVYEVHLAGQVDPEFDARVTELIQQLGDPSFAAREEAQDALARIGVQAARLLEAAATDSADLEVQARLEELLADMMLGETGASHDPPLQEDEVVTSRFTVRGQLEADSFEVSTPYGVLRIGKQEVRRIFLRAPPRTTRVLTLTGKNTVNREYLPTELELEPGDYLEVAASGTVHVRNWGRRFSPEGDPNYGTYSNDIPIGSLIARLGDQGEPFFIGSSFEKQILRGGRLQLAMAFDDGGQSELTTGEWKVRVTVLRGYRSPEEE
jgi:hypothetical protein